jgi:hypothetical protein
MLRPTVVERDAVGQSGVGQKRDGNRLWCWFAGRGKKFQMIRFSASFVCLSKLVSPVRADSFKLLLCTKLPDSAKS